MPNCTYVLDCLTVVFTLNRFKTLAVKALHCSIDVNHYMTRYKHKA